MIIKRNQIIIFVLALLLVTAGYLSVGQEAGNNAIEINANQFALSEKEEDDSKLGDATLVNGTALVPNDITENVISTSNNTNDDYFASSKLQRETMFSQTLESYQKIVESSEISAEQKSIAQNEIIRINNQKNAIMITENLIISKGFKDVVIFVNDKSINVVIKADTLSQDGIAQIQNIVARELAAEIGNIHISVK